MLNRTMLEGFVGKLWSYDGYTFCRLTNRPDPGDEDGQSTNMYTVRLPAAMTVEEKRHIRVEGRLRTRVSETRLAELMKQELAKKVEDLVIPHHITEVVADKMVILQ